MQWKIYQVRDYTSTLKFGIAGFSILFVLLYIYFLFLILILFLYYFVYRRVLYPENGDSMFHRNVGIHLRVYTAS